MKQILTKKQIKILSFIALGVAVSSVVSWLLYGKLKMSTRMVASLGEAEPREISKLSEGQKKKYYLTKGFTFSFNDSQVQIANPWLQEICEQADFISFVYVASEVSYSNGSPKITHTIDCSSIKTRSNVTQLKMSLKDFSRVAKNGIKNTQLTDGSQMSAQLIYRDEPTPNNWRLLEIQVSSQTKSPMSANYTIQNAELNATHSKKLQFIIE